MDKSSSQSVYSARCLGQEQYHQYTTDVLVLGKKNNYDHIKRNKLPLYRSTNKVVVSKIRRRVASLKQDCHLFSSLYVACQSREGDLQQFFSHENHAYGPALSAYGELRNSDTKSDILKEFATHVEPSKSCAQITAEVVGSAAAVQAVIPRESNNFEQYCWKDFAGYIRHRFIQQGLARIDVVFDVYLEQSINSATRSKRGQGKQIKVVKGPCLPRNWKSFLRVEGNKTELFHLLTEELVTETGFKELVITRGNLALSNSSELNKTQLAPCNDEEADTRIFAHIKDQASQGHEVITVVTVDTDVVVIAISCFDGLASTGLKQLWMEFGAGINKRWIPIHSSAALLGERCGGLLFWYAYCFCLWWKRQLDGMGSMPHGKCLMKQHRCSQDIQNHATASIHTKIVCESLRGLHAFCMTGPQQRKMSTLVGESSSQILVEVSMIFLQQGMHWYNIYDEPYIRHGKMKFMYFQ